MTIKRKYVIGIINDEKISEVNNILHKYASLTKESSSHMFFMKQPIDPSKVSQDVTMFTMESESDEKMDEKVKDLIDELEGLNTEYVLRDDETGKFLVTVGYGGQVSIKFGHVESIPKGTFEKIDELKSLHTDFGYCKGFKPNFRPFEGVSVVDLEIEPEIIYIVADSEENLFKFRDYVIQKVREIDPTLKTKFTLFFDQ